MACCGWGQRNRRASLSSSRSTASNSTLDDRSRRRHKRNSLNSSSFAKLRDGDDHLADGSSSSTARRGTDKSHAPPGLLHRDEADPERRGTSESGTSSLTTRIKKRLKTHRGSSNDSVSGTDPSKLSKPQLRKLVRDQQNQISLLSQEIENARSARTEAASMVLAQAMALINENARRYHVEEEDLDTLSDQRKEELEHEGNLRDELTSLLMDFAETELSRAPETPLTKLIDKSGLDDITKQWLTSEFTRGGRNSASVDMGDEAGRSSLVHQRTNSLVRLDVLRASAKDGDAEIMAAAKPMLAGMTSKSASAVLTGPSSRRAGNHKNGGGTVKTLLDSGKLHELRAKRDSEDSIKATGASPNKEGKAKKKRKKMRAEQSSGSEASTSGGVTSGSTGSASSGTVHTRSTNGVAISEREGSAQNALVSSTDDAGGAEQRLASASVGIRETATRKLAAMAPLWADGRVFEGLDLETFGKWGFDPSLYSIDECVLYVCKIFVTFGLPQRFDIEPVTLTNFVRAVQEGYLAECAYHNFFHAVDVVHTVFIFLKRTDCIRNTQMGSLEVLSLLVAALCHDIGHPGSNNTFQVNSQSELALRYNDQSVLENMHAATTFQILRRAECNVLSRLSKPQFSTARLHIVSSILATDMTRHFEMVSQLDGVLERIERINAANESDRATAAAAAGGPAKPGESGWKSRRHSAAEDGLQGGAAEKTSKNASKSGRSVAREDKQRMLNALLHVADISNPCKPWKLSVKWADRVHEEFLKQGDMERARGLPVSPFMDRSTHNMPQMSLNFMDFIVAPLVGGLVTAFPSLNDDIAVTMIHNRERWHNLLLEKIEKKLLPPGSDGESVRENLTQRSWQFFNTFISPTNPEYAAALTLAQRKMYLPPPSAVSEGGNNSDKKGDEAVTSPRAGALPTGSARYTGMLMRSKTTRAGVALSPSGTKPRSQSRSGTKKGHSERGGRRLSAYITRSMIMADNSTSHGASKKKGSIPSFLPPLREGGRSRNSSLLADKDRAVSPRHGGEKGGTTRQLLQQRKGRGTSVEAPIAHKGPVKLPNETSNGKESS